MSSPGRDEDAKDVRVLRSNFKWNGRAASTVPYLWPVAARRSLRR